MKIIIFSESDYNFVAKLTKICDTHTDELVFFENFNSLNKVKEQGLVVIDFNDYKNKLNSMFDNMPKYKNITYCVLVDKMESKIQKKLTNNGFDITMTKHLFLLNYKTIKVQASSN